MNRDALQGALLAGACAGFALWLANVDGVAGVALLVACETAAIGAGLHARRATRNSVVAHAAVAVAALAGLLARATCDGTIAVGHAAQIAVAIGMAAAWIAAPPVGPWTWPADASTSLPRLRTHAPGLLAAAWVLVGGGAVQMLMHSTAPVRSGPIAGFLVVIGAAGLVAAGALVRVAVEGLPRWALAGAALAMAAAVVTAYGDAWLARMLIADRAAAQLPALADWQHWTLAIHALGCGVVAAGLLVAPAARARRTALRWMLTALAVGAVLAITVEQRRDGLIAEAHYEGIETLNLIESAAMFAMAVAFAAMVRTYRRALGDSQLAVARVV